MHEVDRRLPSISAMERAAARRVPKFAFDYLQGGIGAEGCLAANREALDRLRGIADVFLLQQLQREVETGLDPLQPREGVERAFRFTQRDTGVIPEHLHDDIAPAAIVIAQFAHQGVAVAQRH